MKLIPLKHPETFECPTGGTWKATAYYDRVNDHGAPERVFVATPEGKPAIHFVRALPAPRAP